MKCRSLGIFCAAASAVLYGITPVLVRVAYNQALSPSTVIVLRSLISLPVTMALFFRTRDPDETLLPAKKDWKICLPGYAGMALTTLLLCVSYQYIPVGMATTLHYVYPILVNFACVWVFRERISPGKLLSLLMASAGIVLFMEAGTTSNYLGIVLALLSGGCYAFYMVYLSWSGMDRRNPFVHAFWINTLTILMGLIIGWMNQDMTFHISMGAMESVGLMSITDSILAVVLLQFGIRLAGSSTASVLSTLEPITSVLMGYLILQEAMTERKLFGCACIVISVFILAQSELTARSRKGHMES